MGVSTLPEDMTPERWEFIFFVVGFPKVSVNQRPGNPNALSLTPFQLGGATCLWAFVIWFCLPDSPSSAPFFTHRERLIAVQRVASNETGIKTKAFNKSQALRGITDPKSILIFISVFAAYVIRRYGHNFS